MTFHEGSEQKFSFPYQSTEKTYIIENLKHKENGILLIDRREYGREEQGK